MPGDIKTYIVKAHRLVLYELVVEAPNEEAALFLARETIAFEWERHTAGELVIDRAEEV